MKGLIELPASINVMYNKNSNCYQYRLIIYNSKMSNLLFNRKLRAKLIKRKGAYYLIKDSSGNLVTPRPKSQNLFMSIKKMIKEGEFLNLKNKSNTMKIKLNLNPCDWGLTSLDRFLESKEERELAEKLILLGCNVFPITYNDKNKLERGCADLFIQLENKKVFIEITTISPSNRDVKKGINSPHGHIWTRVSGRIFPLLLSCLENKGECFFIMNKKWEMYNHVKYFAKKLKQFNCFVLFSDFENNWMESIANKIYNKIK